MAERFTRQAQQELNPVIAASQQMITPNISATQQLFRNLVAGLEGQAATSVSDINADATARGVGRAGLAQDVTAGLNPALMAGTTGLGAQQAGQLSDLRVAGGQLQADKATLVNQLASSLQESDIDNRKFELDKVTQDREQQLRIQQARQQAARRAAAAAESAANQKGLMDMSESELERLTRLGLGNVQGGDGYVSPENLAKAYNVWAQAGFSAEQFWSKFQGKWNPNQGDYDKQFYYFVQKGV